MKTKKKIFLIGILIFVSLCFLFIRISVNWPFLEIRTGSLPHLALFPFEGKHSLIDLRSLKSLSNNIVDYSRIQLSPNKDKVAFIDYVSSETSSSLSYRILVYSLKNKTINIAINKECNFGAIPMEKCQIHDFYWKNNSQIKYTFDYPGASEWFEINGL